MRLLQRLQDSRAYRRRQAAYPHIVQSGVSHPELVHPTAEILRANLSGPVRVGEYAHVIGPALLVGGVRIGPHTWINGPNTDVFSEVCGVEIGAFCSIARNVTIQEYDHPTDRCATSYVLEHVFGDQSAGEAVSKGPIVIGNDVWVATQCVILSGARIGTGAIIGANSVVTSTIPPYAIAVGSPARVIKYRFPEPIIERLLATAWWDWPRERILRNRSLFEGELTLKKLEAIQD